MTLTQTVNRGYNLMICAFLTLAGLAFGSVIANEADLPDKIDDGGLLLAGILGLAWYLMGNNRYSRSMVPVVLVVLALAAQVAGVFIEVGDKEAFGDNIGGMIIYVPLLVLALFQYRKNAAFQGDTTPTTAA